VTHCLAEKREILICRIDATNCFSQRFCGQQWIANHLANEQPAENTLDRLKRTIACELKLLEICCEPDARRCSDRALARLTLGEVTIAGMAATL